MDFHEELSKLVEDSLFNKAKVFSDYLGFHARAFFFCALGLFSALSAGEFSGLIFTGLMAVSAICFVFAFWMMLFIMTITANTINKLFSGSIWGNWFSRLAGVVYGGFVGLMFWSILRFANSGLSDLMIEASPL